MRPPTHLERVRDYLEGIGCTVVPGGPGLRIEVERAAGNFPMFFFIPRATVTLVAIAEPALQVPPERQAEAAVLLSRMNFGMVNGCFEMNPDGGQLRCRVTVNFAGTPLTADLISNVFHDCDLAMSCFLPVLKAFVEEGATPEMALQRYDPAG